MGVKAVILHASALKSEKDSIVSVPFWRRMGYHEWPGNYDGDERIMSKVLA
jgi:hypothetical protein